MKLDINDLYHQYIIRIVVFALFLYKRQIRQPNVYRMSVLSFTKKRLAWKINLQIDTGVNISREEQRDLIIDELLHNIESDKFNTVFVRFTTPIKEVAMEINLRDTDKYQKFLYS